MLRRYLLLLCVAFLLTFVSAEDDHDDHDHHDHGHDDHDDHDDEENTGVTGVVIGACFVVTLMSCAGIVLITPCASYAKKKEILLNDFIYSFAAGCLLATAGFLMLPEGGHLITAGTDTEGQGSTVYGCSLLGGYLAGAVIHWLADMIKGGHKTAAAAAVAPDGSAYSNDEEAPTEAPAAQKPQKIKIADIKPVVWSVLFGDFLHNFVDGIAIAFAFSACDNTTGWVVAMGAIFHELSQEIADFMVLTENGLTPLIAVSANFVSGLSCVIAGGIAISVEVGMKAQGAMLCFGAGTYMWIAATETFTRIMACSTWKSFGIRFGMFIFGALVIGLVLLGHEHCHAGGAHEGHNH